MFGDWGWDGSRTEEQERRFADWLRGLSGEARLVILEFGAGTSVPTVRYQSEQFAAARPEWYFLFLFEGLKYFTKENLGTTFGTEFMGAIVAPSVGHADDSGHDALADLGSKRDPARAGLAAIASQGS